MMFKNKLVHFFTFCRNISFQKFLNGYKFRKQILDGIKINLRRKGNLQFYEDTFILSSCINPNDNLIYVNYKQPLSEYDRFLEVMNCIKSINNNFPKAKIIYLDNSKITFELEKTLIECVDEYRNYSDNALMVNARKILNKGVPWSLTHLLFFQEGSDFLESDKLHFLNGRYCVTKQLKNQLSGKLEDKTLYIKQKKINVSTIYFLFNNPSLYKIFFSFKIAYIISLMGFSVEDFYSLFNFKVKYFKTIGVHGTINGFMHNNE